MVRPTFLSLILALSVIGTRPVSADWVTTAGQHWMFSCPTNQTFKVINSGFFATDRTWHFSCAKIPILREYPGAGCEWSGYVNDFQGQIHYQCHNEAFLVGLETEYGVGKNDRMYKFRCCEVKGYLVHGCTTTPWVNRQADLLYYRVPDGYVLRGMDSIFVPSDRLFRFEICKLNTFSDSTLSTIIGR